jgi:hypothetical protein
MILRSLLESCSELVCDVSASRPRGGRLLEEEVSEEDNVLMEALAQSQPIIQGLVPLVTAGYAS